MTRKLSSRLFEPGDNPRRVACDHSIWLHIFGHNRPSPKRAAVTNTDTCTLSTHKPGPLLYITAAVEVSAVMHVCCTYLARR